jgi:hypothetical protein
MRYFLNGRRKRADEIWLTNLEAYNLICKHPVCYCCIIGYLLTFNTRFVFSSFSIFGHVDMFWYQYTILRPILQMFANNYRTK